MSLHVVWILYPDDYDTAYEFLYSSKSLKTVGKLGWAKNGASSGTAGYGKRLEGIQIVLVKKGEPAPANTYMGITSVNSNPYIENQ